MHSTRRCSQRPHRDEFRRSVTSSRFGISRRVILSFKEYDMAFAADPGSAASWAATAGGTTAIKGVFTVENGQRGVDPAALATGCLTTIAAVGSGVQTFANAGAGFLPMSAVGAGAGVLAASINGGLSAMGARKAQAGLEKVKSRIEVLQLNVNDPDLEIVNNVVEFCLQQTISKERKGWATAAVVGQVGVPALQAVSAISKTIKKTKGVKRKENATVLVAIARKETPAGEQARQVIAALMAKAYDSILTGVVADAMKTTL
jgi:hypothetical protein